MIDIEARKHGIIAATEEASSSRLLVGKRKRKFEDSQKRSLEILTSRDPIGVLGELVESLEGQDTTDRNGILTEIDGLGKTLFTVVRHIGDPWSQGRYNTMVAFGIDGPIVVDGEQKHLRVLERQAGWRVSRNDPNYEHDPRITYEDDQPVILKPAGESIEIRITPSLDSRYGDFSVMVGLQSNKGLLTYTPLWLGDKLHKPVVVTRFDKKSSDHALQRFRSGALFGARQLHTALTSN